VVAPIHRSRSLRPHRRYPAVTAPG
jgi:hypothetical protein